MTEPHLGPATAGGMLRAARERQGLHIAALAAAIKVSPRKLDALENDRHDELPDATFVRALAQTVCRTLKIDAKPVLELLPPAASMALPPGSGGLGTPFRERPGRVEPGLSPANVRPLVWAAAVLVLAALAVYLVPASWWHVFSRATPVAGDVVPVTLTAPTPVAAPVSVDTPAMAASAAAAVALPAAELAASQAMVETVVSVAPAAPVAPAEAATSAAPMLVAGLLQIRCAEETWIEVRDARGQALLSRNVQRGESVGLDGALPLRVTIGNAAATQLAFRGQPLNLASRTRDNVARLELQ